MKVAIVGAGVSGLVAARGLCGHAEVTVFESARHAGGHARTVRADDPDGAHALDTGFLVFNRRDYPRFDALLRALGVESRSTCMSFSVRCSRTGLEYGGATLGALFAQPARGLDPRYWRMLVDIARFYRGGRSLAATMPHDATIHDLVRRAAYSRAFVDGHLFPLGSALWSAPRTRFGDYPARFVLEFLDRHDLLELDLGRRQRWRTIAGGSARYVEKLVAPLHDRLRLGTPVRAVRRVPSGVRVSTGSEEQAFDHVVFACHGDQALALLEDATRAEREILGAVRYQANDVTLHTDVALLPRSRRARASWNYHVRPDRDVATVTYNLNRLQGIRSRTRYCVTLNEDEAIDPARVLLRFRTSHPQFSTEWIRRRGEAPRIQGVRRAWFCGAYFGSGFHEDGVRSAEETVVGLVRAAGPPAARGAGAVPSGRVAARQPSGATT